MLHCPNQNKQVAQRRYRDCRKAGSPRATSVVSTTAQQNCEENYKKVCQVQRRALKFPLIINH